MQNAPYIKKERREYSRVPFLSQHSAVLFQSRETTPGGMRFLHPATTSTSRVTQKNAVNKLNKPPSNGVNKWWSSPLHGPRPFPSQIRRGSRAGAKCTSSSAASSGIQAKQWRLRIGPLFRCEGTGKMSPWE
jgi:hypothetical protein